MSPELKKEHAVALLIGVPITAFIALTMLGKVLAAGKKYLVITVGEGGTTDPPPGRHFYPLGESVTITAKPEEGYTVGSWIVDGEKVAERVESITVTMDSDHVVNVTFWKEGVPPPAPPAHIKSLGPVTVLSNVGCWLDGTPCWNQHINVKYCGNNWEKEVLSGAPIKFKVTDAAGRGIEGIDVALWTDPPPDTGRYRGTTLLDGEVHVADNPLVKKTGTDGVVQATVSYLYGLNDGFKRLCEDAGLGARYGTCVPPVPGPTITPRDCLTLWPNLTVYWTWGECETGKVGCENMGPFQANRIYAQIVENPMLYTLEWAYCGFRVKWI